jgi:hypothetical protein
MQEKRIGPCLVGVAEGSVEGSAAVEIVIPRHRVVVAVSPAGIGALVDPDEDVDAGIEIFEIVQFVKMGPGVGEALRGGVGRIDDQEPRLLLLRVGFEIAAHKVTIPLPVVLAVGSGVDADEAAAMMDIIL